MQRFGLAIASYFSETVSALLAQMKQRAGRKDPSLNTSGRMSRFLSTPYLRFCGGLGILFLQ